MDIQVKELQERGWIELQHTDLSSLNERLLDIGKQLGRPVPARNSIGLIQELIPTQTPKFPKSLSSRYKNLEFPLHTDTAHWPTPCRYLILGCSYEGENKRNTTIINFDQIQLTPDEKLLLTSEPLKISNGRNSFYGTALAPGRPYLRYDPGCMSPVTSRGHEVFNLFSSIPEKYPTTSIKWNSGKILIIDNWRLLHGRELGQSSGKERIISRVLVA